MPVLRSTGSTKGVGCVGIARDCGLQTEVCETHSAGWDFTGILPSGWFPSEFSTRILCSASVDVIPTSLAAPGTPYTKVVVLHFHRFISLWYKVIGFTW